jgi:hypothetical protein
MTDQEIKAQIERDTERESFRVPYNGTDNFYDESFALGYEKGATAQDNIATNRTLEAAIAIIQNLRPLTGPEIIKELEKLRR